MQIAETSVKRTDDADAQAKGARRSYLPRGPPTYLPSDSLPGWVCKRPPRKPPTALHCPGCYPVACPPLGTKHRLTCADLVHAAAADLERTKEIAAALETQNAALEAQMALLELGKHAPHSNCTRNVGHAPCAPQQPRYYTRPYDNRSN